MSGILPDFVFTTDQVVAKKSQVDAEIQALTQQVNACSGIDRTTLDQYGAFYQSWTDFNNQDVSWWSMSGEYEQAKTFEAQAAGWQTKIDAMCKHAAPPIFPVGPGMPADTISKVSSIVMWGAIALGIVYLVPVIRGLLPTKARA